ncbi:MAG: OmpH family outer membrane protein [Flavobacteriales bacterium]|nr:OmpH family outer membrane protein [Flavobacteriales bacterium]
MTLKINKPYTIITAVIILILVSIFYIIYNQHSKLVFVDNSKLFNEFKMTKDLVKVGEKQVALMNRNLDSLSFILKSSNNTEIQKELTLKIIEQRRQINEFQNNFTNTNSENIWKRINEYVKDFSVKNNYDLVVGSQVNGVFYGKPELDTTDELLEYINKKYEGFE